MNTTSKIALAECMLHYISERWYLHKKNTLGNDCLVLYSEEIAQAVLHDSSDVGNMKVQVIMKLLTTTMYSVSFYNIESNNIIELSGNSISCDITTIQNNATYEIGSVFNGTHLADKYARFFK